jgi:hypothetical protein
MRMTRLKVITGALLALGLVGLGAGLLTTGALSARPPGDPAAAGPPVPRADAPPAADDDKEQPADRRLARNEAESRDNLKQLAVAMHKYADRYRHLPAPAIYAGAQPGAGGAQPGSGPDMGGMMPGRRGRPGVGSMGPGGGSGLLPGAGAVPPMGGGRPGATGGGGAPGGPPGGAAGGPGGGGGGAGATATPGGDAAAGGSGLPGTGAGAARRGGKALLSWRVALLPFLGEANLYKQFRLDEPWDGPHNKKLLAKMPRVYAPPGVKTREPFTTFYQVFVGGGATFEKRRVAQWPASIPDGTSNTILIAEAGTAVPWTKPEDMHYAPDEPLPELGGMYPKVFNVALADGAAAALWKTADPDQLRGAITCAGGEVVAWDKVKAPLSPLAARLREQNQRLKEELAKERARLDELRRKRRVLAEEDADSERLRQENEQLGKLIRDTRDQAERLRQEVERLQQAPGKRPGGRKP